jgi:hypothetical protein
MLCLSHLPMTVAEFSVQQIAHLSSFVSDAGTVAKISTQNGLAGITYRSKYSKYGLIFWNETCRVNR